MSEIWKPVVGHSGYEVSDQGRVRSVDRVSCGRRWKGKILSPVKSGSRCQHLQVKLNARQLRKVHHLVLEAFVGPRPFPKAVGRHGGLGQLDNRVGNLSWGTYTDNINDAIAAGTWFSEKRREHIKRIAANGVHTLVKARAAKQR